MAAVTENWFRTHKVHDGLYLTVEQYFLANQCNIWLIKGPQKDVLIDTGIGVQSLRNHLEEEKLISGDRELIVIITHIHFDHSGGAREFDNVFIHKEDLVALQQGRQAETLNYVKPSHFQRMPYQGFSPCRYKVHPTPCQPLTHGQSIDLGEGHRLEVIHTPGHTHGSAVLYYPQRGELFTGDLVYECGHGGGLFDWLPSSSVPAYLESARTMIGWIDEHYVKGVYPGHFHILQPGRMQEILQEYIDARSGCCCRGCVGCMQATTWLFFLLGCFRCCPC